MEKLAGQLARKNATEADIDHIVEIVEHMAKNFDESDPLDMFEFDMSFHTAIAAASGNKALAETHGTFQRQLWRVRYLAASQRSRRERVVGKYTRILEALCARDKITVRDAIINHLWHLAEDIKEVIEQETSETNISEE